MKKKFFSVFLALVMVLSLGLVMAVPVSAVGALTSVSATPADATEDQTTTYDIGFTTATPYVVDSVEIEFEADFNVSGAALSGTPTGIGEGTVGSALQVVTYTLDASEYIDAGTAITIALSDIVNPTAAGDYEVTVRTMSGTATIDDGTADVTITPLPVSFLVVAGTNNTVTAGIAFSVTITAKDAAAGAGATETGYVGDHFIDFTDVGGPTGTYPDFELISFTDGVGTSLATFIFTDATESDNQIIATDAVLAVAGTSEAITINPAALASFTISAPPTPVVAGEDFDATDITVTALDADLNTVEDYTGTVSWSSTDESAELPADYTFVAGDNGEKVFDAADFILKTVGEEGTQTITVTAGTVSETSDPITVTPATASEWTVEAEPTSIRADNANASVITATVFDEFGNVATGYDGETAAFETSLGTITGSPATFADGEATTTLTSDGEVGMATIWVTSGTLPDITVMVTLVETSLLAEVWVDVTDGNDADSGTESSPVATIQKGVELAAEDGTVNVLPGTYSTTLTLDKAGLTVRSTDGAASTTIVASVPGNFTIQITGDDVTVDGFTVVAGSGAFVGIVRIDAADGATVINNVIASVDTYGVGIRLHTDVADATVSGNELSSCTMYLDGGPDTPITNSTISNNVITDGAITLEDNVEGITISGNIISGCGDTGAIQIWAGTVGQTRDDILISGNTLSNNDSSGIYVHTGSTPTNLTITGNDIANNTADGILIDDWTAASDVIINNNITGNTGEGINNASAVVVSATNNWWGDASGPSGVGPGTVDSDSVTTDVIYSPWLLAAYTEPGTPVTSIELSEGWNLISLMLIPTDPAIELVLSGVTVDSVHAYDPATLWSSYIPDAPSDLETMVDGKGYWVEMSADETLAVLGDELPDPPATPPTYEVVVGWNLIGFKSTTTRTADSYLAAIALQYTMIYGFADGVYFVVQSTDELNPGKGYWIAVTEAGTIYP